MAGGWYRYSGHLSANMINDTAEKCRGCTIKHLSEARVSLQNTENITVLDVADICGNLGHAANHFVHYSPDIAEQIRTLRLDSINNDLTLALDPADISLRLDSIIESVAAWKELEKPVPAAASLAQIAPPKSGGCRCRQKR